jgi:hypothetical protein
MITGLDAGPIDMGMEAFDFGEAPVPSPVEPGSSPSRKRVGLIRASAREELLTIPHAAFAGARRGDRGSCRGGRGAPATQEEAEEEQACP